MTLKLFRSLLLLAFIAMFSCAGYAGVQGSGVDILQKLQGDVNGAVARIRPSVVCIRAQKRQILQAGGEMWFESVGSGMVVDEQGYIVTNAHVVDGGEKIIVEFWTQGANQYTAIVVDLDSTLDLALLQLRPSLPQGTQRAAFADSSKLGIGDWVVSIGSPFGYEHTATLGIVSAMHRELMINKVAYNDMIQTDATINQGNSGGPLLDIFGLVVGLNSAILTPEQAYTGIGFAIPINKVKQFISKTLGAASTAQVPLGFLPLPTGLSGQPAQVVSFTSPANEPSLQPLVDLHLPATNPSVQPGILLQTHPSLPPTAQQSLQQEAPFAQTAQGAMSSPAPGESDQPGLLPGFLPIPVNVYISQSPRTQTVQDAQVSQPPSTLPLLGPPDQTLPLQPVLTAQVDVPVPLKNKEPVDLSKDRPKDTVHETFSDCIACHIIQKKRLANLSKTMPHPFVGDCGTCHIIVNEKVAQGPTTVAWNALVAKIPGAGISATDMGLCVGILIAALVCTALGIDAGLLFVPILLLWGLEFQLAAATSLILSAAIGFPTLLRFVGSGMLDLRLISWIIGPAFFAGFSGGFSAGYISSYLLIVGLCCTLVLAAIFLLRDPDLVADFCNRRRNGGWTWHANYGGEAFAVAFVPAVMLLTASAFFGGMLGTGGGWLLIPSLMAVFSIPMALAAAVAAVAAPIVGLSGFLGQALVGAFNIPLLVPLSVSALLGALAGLLCNHRCKSTQACRLGSLLLGISGVWVLLRTVNVL